MQVDRQFVAPLLREENFDSHECRGLTDSRLLGISDSSEADNPLLATRLLVIVWSDVVRTRSSGKGQAPRDAQTSDQIYRPAPAPRATLPFLHSQLASGQVRSMLRC
jgi:hypothetical protein